jgi:pseudolysin
MKFRVSVLLSGLLMANAVSAATAVNLQRQPAAYLNRYLAVQQRNVNSNTVQIKEIRTDFDFNQTSHTRIQQTYAGTPIWKATAVVHTPKATRQTNMLASMTRASTMNGVAYESLEKDLVNTPAYALTAAQKNKAVQQTKLQFAKKAGKPSFNFKEEPAKQIIFIDDNNQAHYAYLVSFYSDDGHSGAHRPTAIVDATTLNVYRTWDQVFTNHSRDLAAVKTAGAKFKTRTENNNNNNDEPELIEVVAGGVGGNEKMGEVIYDGTNEHQPALNVLAQEVEVEVTPGVNSTITICALMNKDIAVIDVSYSNQVVFDQCIRNPKQHNGIAWLSNDKQQTRWLSDEMNSGYSPSLDAFATASIIQNFYRDWYNIPALVEEDGVTPKQLIMRSHYGRSFDNAFWDGEVMTFGDGGKMFYPLTSLGVSAHEIGHGFTTQHSNIDGSFPQMAALHESFSDMAAAAIEFYQTKTNTWELGREIMKHEGAMRYLNNPTKDGRSIDHLKDFDDTEAHAGGGVTNKAFYLIATTKGWDTQKAFNIMVKANMHYWTSSMTTFADAACGVLSATRDYGYNIADVRVAFAKVGIDTDQCEVH